MSISVTTIAMQLLLLWVILILSLLLTDGAQVFPTSYTISCDHDCGGFSETSDTCTQNGTQTDCYYDSPTTPKLVDCDLETKYPLSTGTSIFTFRFEPPVSLVNFVLHYSCAYPSMQPVQYSYHGHYGDLYCPIAGQFQEPVDVNGSMLTADIRVAITRHLPGLFSLSEVQFFDHTPTGIVHPPSSNITAILSQSLQLFCAADECGTYEWGWYHNGMILSGSKWVIEKHRETRISSLTVHGVDYSDAGIYTCSVSKQGGGQWSHDYTIDVVSGSVTLIQQTSQTTSPLPKSSAAQHPLVRTTAPPTLSSLPPTPTLLLPPTLSSLPPTLLPPPSSLPPTPTLLPPPSSLPPTPTLLLSPTLSSLPPTQLSSLSILSSELVTSAPGTSSGLVKSTTIHVPTTAAIRNHPLTSSGLMKSTTILTPTPSAVSETCEECPNDKSSQTPWIVTTAILATLFLGLLSSNIVYLGVKHLRKSALSVGTKNSAMEMDENPSYAPRGLLSQPDEPPHVYEAI